MFDQAETRPGRLRRRAGRPGFVKEAGVGKTLAGEGGPEARGDAGLAAGGVVQGRGEAAARRAGLEDEAVHAARARQRVRLRLARRAERIRRVARPVDAQDADRRRRSAWLKG